MKQCKLFFMLLLLCFSTTVMAQVTITGTVTDSETGEAMPVVSVMEKGTTNGTSTSENGTYSLTVKDANSVLQFTFVGFGDVEVTVGSRSVIDVTMGLSMESLGDVVVVGYGTQKKVNLTGAISQISGEELASKPVSNVMNALQGELAGVSITRNSGQPGNTGAAITIRGASSVNDASALVLIDGIPGDMNTLNPNDIESVSVLKDAAAASIYGSRAAAGVVLITTKKGASEDGKVKVTYDGYFSLGTPGRMGERLSSWEEQEMINISRLNQRGNPELNPEITSWVGNPNFNYRPHMTDKTRWDFFSTNNWLDESFRDVMPATQHTVAVSGGTKKFNFRTSAGYQHEEGFFKYGPDDADRYNFTINLNSEINKYIDLSVQANYSNSYRNENPNYSTIITNAFRSRNRQALLVPEEDPYYDQQPYNGDLQANPVALQKQAGERRLGNDVLIAKGGINIKDLVPGLNIQLNAIRNQKDYNSRAEQRTVMAYNREGGSRTGTTNNPNSLVTARFKEWRNTFQAIATYKKTFVDAHNFQLMAGTEFEDYRYDRVDLSIKGMINNDFFSFNYADISTLAASDEVKASASMSYFGRFNYDYKGKYLLEANLRYDGSSRLAPGHRWKAFPSFSLGWRISEESFMKDIEWINNLKIRGSWGELGNSGGIGYYDYMANILSGKDIVFGPGNSGAQATYYYQAALASQKMSWEILRSTNVGVDFALFRNRLNVTAEYYWKENRDMLISMDAPHIAGVDFPKVNVGKLKSWGWEIDVRWKDKIGQVDYWVGFNLSDPQNKLVEYGGVKLINAGNNQFVEGYPINSMWLYKTDGYWKSRDEYLASGVESFNSSVIAAGDIKYLDLDKSGDILSSSTTADNPKDLYNAGTSDPRFLFGINMGANWNNFDISIFFQGVGKREFLLNTEVIAPFYRSYFMPLTIHRDYWTEDNTNAMWPRLYEGGDFNYKPSDRWVQNGRYIRMKNLQVGYTIPVSKDVFQKLRVYFSGDNLFEITNTLKIVDPESPQNVGVGAYPFARTFTLGVNVVF